MKLVRLPLLFLLSLMLSACACHRIHEGVVVSKRAHKGAAINPMRPALFFHLPQPDLNWVDVQGKTAKGTVVTKHIAVFRADAARISVGDHWTQAGGFECKCCVNKRAYK